MKNTICNDHENLEKIKLSYVETCLTNINYIYRIYCR